MLIYLCWLGLVLTGITLIYQDFKSRLISVWLIILFTICIISLFIITHSIDEFIVSAVVCLAYFLFCYLILHLYFYLKTKRFQKLFDTKVGWGDVFLLIAVGSTISPEKIVYFFTITFVSALITHYIFFKRKAEVPLAGYLLVIYSFYLLHEGFAPVF